MCDALYIAQFMAQFDYYGSQSVTVLGVTLTPLTPPMSPIPNHAKIDVPEAHPSRSGATKARWDPQGTPKGGWEWRYGSYGASVACLPLVLRHANSTGFSGLSPEPAARTAHARNSSHLACFLSDSH